MKSRIRLFMISAQIVFCLATPLTAAPLPHAGVFVYSTLCESVEDAAGAEIVLLRGPAGDTALFTRTEGPIMAPLLAFGPNVSVDDRTGHITLKFVDPEFGNAGTYLLEGSITDDEIELSSSIGRSMKLPRVRTFVSSLPKCKS